MPNFDRESVSNFLIEKHKWFFLISIIVFIFCAVGIGDLKQQAGYRVFFHEGNKDLQSQRNKEKDYSSEDQIVFVVESKQGDVLSKDNLKTIETLTEESWQIPFSIRVESITNFQHSEADEDTLIIDYFYSSERDVTDEAIASLKRKALDHPELKNLFITEKETGTLVQVKLGLSDDLYERVEQRNESVEHARKLAREIESVNPDLQLHMVGRTMLNKSFEEMVAADNEALIPVMFLIIIVLMMLLTKSVKATVSSLLLIILSVIMTLGFMGWVGFAVNQTNSQITIIILSIAICNCVHILSNYRQNFCATDDMKKALKLSYESNLKSILLTNFTTILGFMSMNLSDSPVYQELGTAVSFGIISAYFLTLCLLPAVLLILRTRIKPSEKSGQVARKFVDSLLSNRKPIFWVGSILTITISSMTALNVVNDDLITYFSEGHEFRVGAEFVQDNVTGFDEVSFELNSGVSDGVKSPEFLAVLDNFCSWLEQQNNVVHVRCFSKIMKRLNQNMNSDDPAFYAIPDDLEVASQYLLLYELSLPYGLDLTNMINFDKSSSLVSVMLANANTNDFLRLENDVNRWFEENEPSYATKPVSLSYMFANIGLDTIKNMVSGSIVALLLIAITLCFAFKSMKFGLMSILPNAFPALMIFGLWGLFVGEVNMPVAVIFSVTIGIIVDDTVHFITKYLHARRVDGKSPDEALKDTFYNVGRALVVTTIILSMGFFTLALSTFEVNAILGLMAGGTILMALILDFILLPILIKLIDKDEQAVSSKN